MFFDSWDSIGRILVAAVCSYGFLLVLLRTCGKRTLASLTAYDFVVNVALGSTLATILLSKETAILEGLTALTALLLLQTGVAALNSRFERCRKLCYSEPTMLVHQGVYCEDAMRRTRVNRQDVEQVLRMKGRDGPQDGTTVILEANGKFSVLNT